MAVYVGLDLGTTNSAAAVFDGEKLTVVRSAQGGVLTPSVVRISRKGTVTVGAGARRYLDRDPQNTRSEFKRLMGTGQTLAFPGAGVERSPEELAAYVLEALRADVEQLVGFAPTAAVVTVPALFEVPQSAATARAAARAGLERTELLQEPVASALAAGWSAEASTGPWLVYDLGGGTFDVSLLETRHGLLRVVGHDGDNFLGGRDVDRLLVDWAIVRLAEQDGVVLRRDDPTHRDALRQLTLAAEEAKIQLSRQPRAVIALPNPLEIDGDELEVELEVDVPTMERLAAPLIDRSIDVCRRLLADHGVRSEDLERIVLVGGPTVVPWLRERVEARLGPIAGGGLDPMTLVAQGAALYAASAGLEARPAAGPRRATGVPLRLQYPTMTSDPTPFVVGRIGAEGRVRSVRLVRVEPPWESAWAEVDAEGTFALMAELRIRSANRFRIEARDGQGASVAVNPDELTVVHGVAIGDPPLSRTIGVALANDAVQVYFERGTPLPARRTFVHHTVETVIPGSGRDALRIPIVQGELERAHLCRLVGTLDVPAAELDQRLPVGSPIEVTLELDRGGQLSARALIASTQQVFEQIAHLLVPDAAPETLEASLGELARRIAALENRSLASGDTTVTVRLMGVREALEDARSGVAAARGGDTDAAQRVRRNLLEIEAEVAAMETAGHWPELEADAAQEVAAASMWVSQYGTDVERTLLDQAIAAVEAARQRRAARDLERQLRVVRRLASAAFHRHPKAWEWNFEHAASRVSDATDLRRADALVERGRAAARRGDTASLRSVTQELLGLLPVDVHDRARGFLSGVR